MCNCHECKHYACRKGARRGYMDCDPDECFCRMNNEYFEGAREYDEETEEELDCEDFVYAW